MSAEQMLHYQSKLAYEVDSADVYSALQDRDDIVVIDGRSPEAFAKEHIPGAVNLPHRDISANTTHSLDKTKTYACYCDGIGCNASTKAALKLLTLGFNVKELMGGLDWWKRDGYSTDGKFAQSGTEINCGC